MLSRITRVAIIGGLRGHTTGYAIPQFVIDGPGGGGKIPINPNYVVDTASGRIPLRDFEVPKMALLWELKWRGVVPDEKPSDS